MPSNAALAEPETATAKEATNSDYASWTNSRLIERVLELEQTLRANLSQSSSMVNSNVNKDNPTISSSVPPSPIVHTTAAAAVSATPGPDATAAQATSSQQPQPKPRAKKPQKQFDPLKWTTRHIALKFAYLGASFNGFEHHLNNKTPLPTVEEELWKALVRTRLIAPKSLAKHGLDRGAMSGIDAFGAGAVPVDWEGCRYSKCGRTDRGVSAFGQVIGVQVRSLRKRRKMDVEDADTAVATAATAAAEQTSTLSDISETSQVQEQTERWEVDESDGFDSVKDELNYVSLLNRVLPSTIRMLAWCPNPPPNFDARFSCKEREYRYFFTQPAYLPIPGSGATLDIEAMQQAAEYLIGSHDFRNLCKIDPAKQITEFIRKMRTAKVEKVDTFESPQYVATARDPAAIGAKMAEAYCIRISGTAFLWHQVRCIVGVLFLVGQGYEKPEIVKQLLDVANCPAKPAYEMADDRPLVLWDCRFSATAGRLGPDDILDRPLHDRGEGADELDWAYPGSASSTGSDPLGGKWNKTGIMEDLWKIWRATKMDEILAAQLLDVVAQPDTAIDEYAVRARQKSVQLFQGEDTSVSKGTYVPVMKKRRLKDVDAANAHWLSRKGPEHHRVRRMFGSVQSTSQPLDS